MADNTEQLEARKWIDSLEDKWRLQVLSKRQRFNVRTGERKDMPTRVRRFVEGTPWAYVTEGIRYLISKAPYRGILFNGVRLDEEYRPTLTTWRRDDQDTVNGQQRTDGTYTLIQDLLAIDEADVYGTTTSASCSEEVVSEWHWDEAEPEDLPEPAQGVTWQIQANRKEDGTFDYVLIKRVAITQQTGETVVKDTTTERVRSDSWNNVYTDDDGNYVDNYGTPLDIPEASSANGVTCEVSKQINDDCTYRIQAQWTESKDATVRENCQKTQFEHEHAVSKVGQAAPLGEAPEASGGVVTRHEDQLQPDGLFSTVESTQTELPVTDAVVKVSVGRKGRRIERTDRNQAEPAPTEGLGVGQGVEVEKTPGKLYNNTRINFDLSDQQRVAESCEIDQFKHDHSETIAGVDEIPGIDEHVEGSGENGDVKTRQTQMDDEGAITQTNAVHHEKEVLKHRETWQVGLRGVRHSVTDTQTSPDNVPSPPSYSKENIGKTVSVEKTPGGLVNITTEDTARETPLDAGEACAKTVFEHRDSTTTNDPDGGFLDHVPDAGGGTYYENQSRLNEDGTSTVEQTKHQELEVLGSELEIRRTAKAVYRTTTDKNVARSAAEPAGIGLSRHTTNPGGTHDVTETSVEVLNLPDRAHCAQTVFEHEHDTVEVSIGVQADNSDTPAPGGGHHYSKESSVDDQGIVTTVLRDNEEKESRGAVHAKRKSLRGVTETVIHRNTSDPTVTVDKVGDEVRVERTPGGLYTRTETHTSKEPVGKIGEHCAKTAFEHAHGTTTNEADAPKVDVKRATGTRGSIRAAMTDEGAWNVDRETVTGEQQTWTAGSRETVRVKYQTTGERNVTDAHPVSGVGSSSSYRMNELGLLDGEYTEAEAKAGGRTAESYRESELVSDHSYTETGDSNGASNPSSSAGKIGTSSSRQNEDGSWDNTEGTSIAKEKKYEAGTRETIRVKYTSHGERNVKIPHPVSGTGSSSRYQMNEFGLLDGEYTEAELKHESGNIRDYYAVDAFEDTELHTEVGEGSEASRPSVAHGSKGYSDSRQNDDGSWDNTDSTTTAIRQDWHVGTRETMRVKYVTHGERNVDSVHEVSGVGSSSQYRMNDLGKLDGEYTEAELKETGQTIRDAYADTHHEHTESHTRVGEGSDAASDDLVEGRRSSSDSRMNDDGTWDNTESTSTHEPQELTIMFKSDDLDATYKWWLNQSTGHSQSVADGLEDDYRNSVSGQINDFGSENGTATSYQIRDKDAASDLVSWGWNMCAGREYYEYRQHKVSTGGTPEIKSQRAKFKRYHGEGLWKKYSYAIDDLEKMLESGRGGNHSLPDGYGVDRYSFGMITLVSGRRCYRIQYVSSACQVSKWEDFTVQANG